MSHIFSPFFNLKFPFLRNASTYFTIFGSKNASGSASEGPLRELKKVESTRSIRIKLPQDAIMKTYFRPDLASFGRFGASQFNRTGAYKRTLKVELPRPRARQGPHISIFSNQNAPPTTKTASTGTKHGICFFY